MTYVDPEGPNGWIKDRCPECGAGSGERCRSKGGVVRAEPHMKREVAWSERRVRET